MLVFLDVELYVYEEAEIKTKHMCISVCLFYDNVSQKEKY